VTGKLIESGMCCGMGINVEKTKVIRISREPFPLLIMVDHKQLENVEYFKCFGTMITNNTKCTREIKHTIAVGKAAFNRKKTFSLANWFQI
jgi:hypothetical protein